MRVGRSASAVDSSTQWTRRSVLCEMHRSAPEKHQEPDLTIRRALVDGFPYGVFFIWDEASDATSVIACMHARRDPRRWLQRA
jgi:hypothetical protein